MFVMHDMASGGAQRSLLSLFSELEKYQDRYELNLMLMKREGLFFGQIPPYIKLVEIPNELICMHSPVTSKIFWKACRIKSLIAKIKWQFVQRHFDERDFGEKQQSWWDIWRKIVPASGIHYDAAISYMHGCPNYYLIDKVNADHKTMWIHAQYSEKGRDVAFDRRYYAKADQIVTVSDRCAEHFTSIFPELKEKVRVILNISSGKLIWHMAKMSGYPQEYEPVHDKKIISIGRLSYEKGFDLALAAAKTLKDAGYHFKWFFIGIGPLHNSLLDLRAELELEEFVAFLGERINPYGYLHHADVFVQTSRIEGKSIVLDEAKILCKPIVVTEYGTVRDNIIDRQQGLIVKTDSSAIASGIQALIDDRNLCTELERNLADQPDDLAKELSKYLQLMDE